MKKKGLCIALGALFALASCGVENPSTIPSTHTVAPTPSSTTPVPSSTASVPSSSTSVPSSTTPVPSSTTPVPSSTASVPSSTTPVPSSTTPVPSSSTTITPSSTTTTFVPVVPTAPTKYSKLAKLEGYDYINNLSSLYRMNLSISGFLQNEIFDFVGDRNTEGYVQVSTAKEFLEALKRAKWNYESSWVFDEDQMTEEQKTNIARYLELMAIRKAEGSLEKPLENERLYLEYEIEGAGASTAYPGHLEQKLISCGSIRVIEITEDLELGYKDLLKVATKEELDALGVTDFASQDKGVYMSSMVQEHGMSQISVSNMNGLLIYSQNGAKLLHGGFKINSSKDLAIRNLEFDEMWQWEDTSKATTGKMGDYDAYGWAYMKINFSDNIWVDHCTFGKSFDGNIDVANPVYNTFLTSTAAPYGADGTAEVQISSCAFNAGSDDENGYVVKMMEEIEKDYTDNGGANCLYYKALRDAGITQEEILYGIAIPQKKAFLCGDSGNGITAYKDNKNLRIGFANCTFKNIEDRIPKIRGGLAYMYNCMTDNREYLTYRTKLQGKSAASKVSEINSSWKCALVSQDIVVGNGGSFYAEHCVFVGVSTYVKNNDSGARRFVKTTDGYVYENVENSTKGYAILKDCNQTFSSTSNVTSTDFDWHGEEGKINTDGLLISVLQSAAEATKGKYVLELRLGNQLKTGVNLEMKQMFLASHYKSPEDV